MTKPKPLGMQKLSAQLSNFRTKSWVGYGFVATAAINIVAHYGMLYPGEMHSNLMSAPGLQFDIEQRKPIEALANAVIESAGRPLRTIAIRVRWRGSRAIGWSIRPVS